MKRLLKEQYAFVIILGACIWSKNWAATFLCLYVLAQAWFINEYSDIMEETEKEVRKWHEKYIEAKYPKHQLKERIEQDKNTK